MRTSRLIPVGLAIVCLGVGAAVWAGAHPALGDSTATPSASPSASVQPTPSATPSPSATPTASPALVAWSRHWARLAGRQRLRVRRYAECLGIKRSLRALPARLLRSAPKASWAAYGRTCKRLAHRWYAQSQRLGRLLAHPVAVGRLLAAQHGWTGGEWSALYVLWTRESTWRVDASNGSCWGIPQANPGSRMAAFGSDWRTNAATQIRWGLSYISGRYGCPSVALAHSYAHNWY